MHTHTGRAIAVPELRNIDVHPGTGTALASMVLNPGPHPGTTTALQVEYVCVYACGHRRHWWMRANQIPTQISEMVYS